MFYKMKNGLCPDYPASLVPATVGSALTYPLRNSSDLQTLHTNSRLYYTVSHFSYAPLFQGPHFLTKMMESNILYDNLFIDILSV